MAHSHSHVETPPSPELERQQRRALGWMILFLVPIAVWTLAAMVYLWPHDMDKHVLADSASWNIPGVTTEKATISKVVPASCEGVSGSTSQSKQSCGAITVQLDSGPEKGSSQTLPLTQPVFASSPEPGQQVLAYRVPTGEQASYQFADFERSAPMLFFAALFVVSVIAVARMRGLLSMIGLGFAFVIMAKFMFPALIVGHNPIAVGLVGSSAIMFVALYCAHGFSTRTTTALVGTLVGLAITAALGVWAGEWAHLTGVSSEDDFLLAATAPDLTLRSMVLCGIIIAGLGVLNDVTITQSSAVWELAATEHRRGKLFNSAMRIGRDHIASTVYTTAFATAGAAMGVLLLLTMSQRPLLQAITSEQFAGEVVRTLVGSIGLVLAVPVTTAVAVAAVSMGGRSSRVGNDDVRPTPVARVTEDDMVERPAPARGSHDPADAKSDPSIYRRPGRAAD